MIRAKLTPVTNIAQAASPTNAVFIMRGDSRLSAVDVLVHLASVSLRLGPIFQAKVVDLRELSRVVRNHGHVQGMSMTPDNSFGKRTA
jgi:hypothetical protein